MVWPIVAAGAAGVAAGMYGSERANKISSDAIAEAQRNRENRRDAYREAVDPAYQALQDINYDYLADLETGPAGTYDPAEYDYIPMSTLEEYGPWMDVAAEGVADSPEARSIQYQALQDLQTRAEEGLSAEDQAGFLRGQQRAGEMAAGREGAIMRNMQARGMGGSGVEAALRQIGSQQAAGALSLSEAERAASQARERALATQAAMAGGERLRAADIDLNRVNANIMNEFNWNNSAMKRKYDDMNTEMRNKRVMDAINEQRRLSGLNTAQDNQAGMYAVNQAQAGQDARNRQAMAIGEGKNQALVDAYNAAKGFHGDLYGMGDQTDLMMAKGAAGAGYERDKWNAIGQIPGAAVDAYKFDQMYPSQGAASPASPAAVDRAPYPAANPGPNQVASYGANDPALIRRRGY